MKYEFEIGGQVKISDRWYEIKGDRFGLFIDGGVSSRMLVEAITCFIQDYEPPEEAFMEALAFNDSDHITVTFSTGLTVTFTTEQLLKLQAL